MDKRKQEELFRHIDEAVSSPPPCMEDAINEAIEKGRMTLQEGMDCLAAYTRTFIKSKEVYEDNRGGGPLLDKQLYE